METEDGSATLTAFEIDASNNGTEACQEVESIEVKQQQQDDLDLRDHAENRVNEEIVPGECEDLEMGCRPLGVYCSTMKTKLENELEKLKKCSQELERYVTHFEMQRAIVEVPKLIDLFSGKCQVSNCPNTRTVTHTTATSGVIVISFTCPDGHSGLWHSSSVLCSKREQNVYALPTILCAGCLISGNNFEKVELMLRSCNVEFVSSSTFNRMQSLYVVPTVQSFWEKMKTTLIEMYSKETMVLCGDGRMDSPGFSAKYCAYVTMEQHLGSIIDLEVIDKRETGGTSTNMERLALKRLILRLMHQICIEEIATDASATMCVI